MSLPEVYLIGAPRCGTTTIYHGLVGHPGVFMCPVKEPRTLSFPGGVPATDDPQHLGDVPDETTYLSLFDGATPEQLRGEASTNYLSDPVARARIARDRPDAHIIAVLRDPVARAYSNFMQHRRDGQETTDDFAVALADEAERLAAGWSPYFGYRRMSTYADDISAWKEAFPDMLVLLYEDLERHPKDTFRRIYRFLGIDDHHEPVIARRNASGLRRDKGIAQRLLNGHGAWRKAYNRVLPARLRTKVWLWLNNRTLQRDPAPEAALAALRADLRDDIERTASLIGRDLSHWTQP